MVVSETVYSTETYFAVFTDLDVFLFSSSHTQLITRYNSWATCFGLNKPSESDSIMNVSHLKILNNFILFHGTGRSYTILHTAKTCSVAICSRSVEW